MSPPEFTLLPDGLPAIPRRHRSVGPEPLTLPLELLRRQELPQADLRRTARRIVRGSHAPRPRPAAGAGYSRRARQSGRGTAAAGGKGPSSSSGWPSPDRGGPRTLRLAAHGHRWSSVSSPGYDLLEFDPAVVETVNHVE